MNVRADILRCDWANPVLVLNLRRMVRSRLFIGVGAVWVALQLVMMLPLLRQGGTSAGTFPVNTYFRGLMAGLVTVFIMVMPVGLFSRISREQRESRMELVVITRMTAAQVCAGYLWIALVQMGLYLSLCFPFMLFASLCGGLPFGTVLKAIYLLLLTGLVYHASALMLGSFCRGPASTVVASMIFYPVHVIAVLRSLVVGVIGYLLFGMTDLLWPPWKTNLLLWDFPLFFVLATALWAGFCLLIAQGNIGPCAPETQAGGYTPHTPSCPGRTGVTSAHDAEARGAAPQDGFSRRRDIAVLGRRHAAGRPSVAPAAGDLIGRDGRRGTEHPLPVMKTGDTE